MEKLNEDIRLAQQAYLAASEHNAERSLIVWQNLLRARNELVRELAKSKTGAKNQS